METVVPFPGRRSYSLTRRKPDRNLFPPVGLVEEYRIVRPTFSCDDDDDDDDKRSFGGGEEEKEKLSRS